MQKKTNSLQIESNMVPSSISFKISETNNIVYILSPYRTLGCRLQPTLISPLFLDLSLQKKKNINLVVSHAYCVVFFALLVFILCLVYTMLPVSLDCPFLIAPPVFSNILLLSSHIAWVSVCSLTPTIWYDDEVRFVLDQHCYR